LERELFVHYFNSLTTSLKYDLFREGFHYGAADGQRGRSDEISS